jgi:AraC-like DNA-binding protein/mannose-6-phosphate isomerase-like protein (cupin superfamily)
MARTRRAAAWHDPGNVDDPARPVIAVAHDRPGTFEVPWHRHRRGQLLYATEGVMRVSAADSTWIVPPQQAVWVPPGVGHTVTSLGPMAMRTLYVHSRSAAGLPGECCVFSVSPLLREMILYALTLPLDVCLTGPQARLIAVIPDLLATLRAEPLQLPLPADRRLRTIADALLRDPTDHRPLREWGVRVGASERTLARRFRGETGMGFRAWRQRLRLQSAITRLSEGTAVTAVAYELGYASPSAFVAMFRRKLGAPPRRYLRSPHGAPGFGVGAATGPQR